MRLDLRDDVRVNGRICVQMMHTSGERLMAEEMLFIETRSSTDRVLTNMYRLPINITV